GMVLIGVVLLFIITWRNRNSRIRIHMGLDVPSPVMDYGKLVIYSLIIIIITYMLSRYNGLPMPLLIVITLAGIFMFISAKTAFGRSIYAIGGNPEAARLSGINIKRNTLMVFVLMGALAGIAGVILTSRLNAATTSAGDMYELDAIAACVIGVACMVGVSWRVGGA